MTLCTIQTPVRDAETESASHQLSQQRERINSRLLAGATGAEVVGALTELVDGLIIGRYRTALRKGEDDLAVAAMTHCCLVALGGYGRRELAPHSDVDVMVLVNRQAGSAAEDLSKHVLHYLWDLGFQVGHSVRTIEDCLDLAPNDLAIRTSLMESRFLVGSASLFQEFHRRYMRQVSKRGVDRFLEQKLEERRREYEKFGETVYLLEPNVKKSKGGLRDLHLLQWIGMAKYQAGTLHELADRGILARPDVQALAEAREFLWKVRALLHFGAGMAQEMLTFDEQVRLAALTGFQDRPHLLAVEQFMQQYYRLTMGLHERAMRFLARCRSVPMWHRVQRFLPTPRLEGQFVQVGEELSIPTEERAKVLDDPIRILTLFEVARNRRLVIAADLQDEVLQHAEALPSDAFTTPEASAVFLRIVSDGGGVARTLEAMHRAHVLEKLVPAFAAVRGLMQFNQYHKYTVDEHSLLAVAKAEALGVEDSVIGSVYREIKRKDLLHLALLLHDLGKGQEEDHSEVGKRLAEDLAARLRFNEEDTRTLVFLVHQHLLMAHTAFRRDPHDDKVLLPFARAAGTPAVLRKLLVLTAADIAAVGPGVLTKWKESLLVELYLRTLPEVSGEREAGLGEQHLKALVAEVARLFGRTEGEQDEWQWIDRQMRTFPTRYVHGTPPDRIVRHLAAIRALQPGSVSVEGAYQPALQTCEYTVVTTNSLTPGLFSKIAGVMAAKGLHVLDAQIITRQDDVVVDTFQVQDPDYRDEPPVERLQDVAVSIERVLLGRETVDAVKARCSRLSVGRRVPVRRQPTEVQIDNETSDRHTILDVFADDCQGLLSVITHAIFALGLSVHAARISTRLDQVADVFYVTGGDGRKIVERAELDRIRRGIGEAVDRFLAQAEEARGGVLSALSS